MMGAAGNNNGESSNAGGSLLNNIFNE